MYKLYLIFLLIVHILKLIFNSSLNVLLIIYFPFKHGLRKNIFKEIRRLFNGMEKEDLGTMLSGQDEVRRLA